jgi:hypothetical protein
MKRPRLTLGIVAATSLFAGAAITLSGCQMHSPPATQAPWYTTAGLPAAADRVGTVDRTELLIAYYGSAMFDEYLQDLRQRHEAALAADNYELASQLEHQGESGQEHAHQQLAGKEGVEDILIKIEDVLAAVMREHNLDMIVEAGTWEVGEAQLIDVTEAIVSEIPPRQRAS